MNRNNYQAAKLCHRFINEHVSEGDICIDGTAGRGNDTLLLCELVGDSGRVIAFDIQEEAIADTERNLVKHQLRHRAHLVLGSHIDMKQYADEASVSCIVFNFGYLPGADHNIATKAATSVEAIRQGLSLLKAGGIMCLCIYSGGDSGFEEKDAVLNFLKTLDQKTYLVILNQYFNRSNNPPIPALIIKH